MSIHQPFPFSVSPGKTFLELPIVFSFKYCDHAVKPLILAINISLYISYISYIYKYTYLLKFQLICILTSKYIYLLDIHMYANIYIGQDA